MAKSNQPPGVSASSWAINGGKPLEKPAVAKAIAETTARLGDRGPLVIRPSGTEPVVRVMGEAYDKALVNSLVGDVCDAVTRAA
jgi:phosphoglucosamine mutase